MGSIEPLSGWLLDRIVVLDEAKPGFAGFMLRTSAERRQVVAAFLAAVDPADDMAEEAAHFLMGCRHHAILQLAFEHVPVGFRAALVRCGAKVHDRDFYIRLWALLTRGPQHIVTAIRHSAKLNPERLAIITGLPADLSDHRISAKIKDKAQADDIVLAVDLLVRRGLDRAAIVEALRQSTKLADTIKRWSLRIAFPRGPISASEHYRPVNNGVELAATAKRYRNCSRRYFTSLLEADHAFGEFQHEEQKVLISFDRSQGFWLVDGVYGYRNGDVPAGVSEAAYAFAARHGVITRRATDRGDKAMEALRRLSRHYMDWDV
ncbi:hypothetical protein [Sphingobium sp. D43FB]|uniref:hypothetical protein n=1 Tax=Sphingobium sp. D43FB TaxID=2017595 RepID=UPI000BB54996|nr:hypothetical protein [Sphingobium sp. D43FB]PBN41656.1 hypothetical protein SxD43FB_20575 [Sphingobium sp. D43FB]